MDALPCRGRVTTKRMGVRGREYMEGFWWGVLAGVLGTYSISIVAVMFCCRHAAVGERE